MTRRGDWYYLFYSTKGCCGPGCDYQLEVSRAKNLRGPWEASPLGPLLTGGGAWKCPGHGTMVSLADGRDYFLYHAYPTKGDVFLGRQGLLDELHWPEDGWPAFACGTSPSESAPLPFRKKPRRKPPMTSWTVLNLPNSHTEWQWTSNIRQRPKSLTENSTWKFQTVQAARSTESVVKQADYTFTATIDPKGAAKEGIGIYGDEKNLLGLTIDDGSLKLWKSEKGALQPLAKAKLPEGASLRLRMTVRDGRRFASSRARMGNSGKPSAIRESTDRFCRHGIARARIGLMVSGKPGDVGNFEEVELRYGRQ